MEMQYTAMVLALLSMVVGCTNKPQPMNTNYCGQQQANQKPRVLYPDLIHTDRLVHRGVFSPDLQSYYYTVSDKSFQKFDILMIRCIDGFWSTPVNAEFDSKYDDHGMSFSSDGQEIYFSSTRPLNEADDHPTWHIWKSEKYDDGWTAGEYVHIPNADNQLLSHPSLADNGSLYFHMSHLDYSNMNLYSSSIVNGQYQEPQRVYIPLMDNTMKCTPFISSDEKFLIFASIGDQLDLHISYRGVDGNWSQARRLSDGINTNGQGNPSVASDNKTLMYTVGSDSGDDWAVRWVDISDEITN